VQFTHLKQRTKNLTVQAAYKVWGRSAGENILNEDAPRACNPLSLFSQQHGSNKDVLQQQQRASRKILSLSIFCACGFVFNPCAPLSPHT
jgi:hypothetical protein